LLVSILAVGAFPASYAEKGWFLALAEPVAAFSTVFFTELTQSVQSLLGCSILGYFANISFAMYLIHGLVISAFAAPFAIMLQELIPSLSWNGSLLLTLPLFYGITILFAHILYLLVDQPSVRFAKKLWTYSQKRATILDGRTLLNHIYRSCNFISRIKEPEEEQMTSVTV